MASNTDADICGRVPLHQTNLLQPHGVLLVTDQNFRIIQCGENVNELLGLEAREVAGQHLENFVAPGDIQKLEAIRAQNSAARLPAVLSFHSGKRLATVKCEPLFSILEIEKEAVSISEENSFINIYEHLKKAIVAVEATQTTEEACRVAITELKRISGFDKVMVYRFDEQWNGDVIAEVMEEGMDAYLGLKFPSSDVPRQARELYRRTPYRLIPNIRYEPVRLYPLINPLTNAFTDLSDSNLRSVAQVHLEYLSNMKVAASMSTRILLNNELWGLIACHHRTPRYLSYEFCAVFDLLSTIISSRIAALQNREQFLFKAEQQQEQNVIKERAYRHKNLMEALLQDKPMLLQLLSAEGVVVVLDRQMESAGIVPDKIKVEDLLIWLQSRAYTGLYHEPQLSQEYEAAGAFSDIGSGLLALPIQAEKGNYVLAFRPEVIQTVNWGGNPNEAVQFEPDGVKYHPRTSFGIWQQTVRQKAKPWKAGEIEMAEQLRNFMVEFTLRLS